MAQILVGGDNPDAYSICDAIEQKVANRSLPVVFCTTPHEVLNTLARGGAAAVVLNFEQAGLTNFELAYRIREAGTLGNIPILMPEVDALGDVSGALGSHVGIFAFPVQPDDVAALAGKLIDAALQAAAQRPAPKAVAAPSSEKEAPLPRRAPAETTRPPAVRHEHAVTAPPETPAVEHRESSAAGAAPGRGRRVRHRTWKEVRAPRSRRAHALDLDAEPTDDAPARDSHPPEAQAPPAHRAGERKLLRVALILAAVAVPVFGYYGCQAYRSAMEDRAAATPERLAELACSACGVRESRPVSNIHEVRCRKCGAAVGFACHCNDCKHDFAWVPPSQVKNLDGLKAKPECPKCKSWNVTLLKPETKAAKPAGTTTAKGGKGTVPAKSGKSTAPAKATRQGGKPAAEEE